MPRPTPGSRSRLEHDQGADASFQASPLPPPWFVPEPSQPQFRTSNAAVESQMLSRPDSTESGRVNDDFDNNSVHTGNEHGDSLSWYHEATSQGQREAEALLEAFYDRPTPSSLLGDEGAMDEHVSSQGPSFVETLEPGCNTGQNMSPVARASYGIKSEIPNIEHATGGAIYGASYGTHDVSAYGRTSPMSLRELNESTASSLSQPMKGTENWSTAASNDVSIDVAEAAIQSSALPPISPSKASSFTQAHEHVQNSLSPPSPTPSRDHFDEEPIDDRSLSKPSDIAKNLEPSVENSLRVASPYAEKQPSLDEVDAAAADAVKSMAYYLNSLDEVDGGVTYAGVPMAENRYSLDGVKSASADAVKLVVDNRPSLDEVDAAAADAVKSMAEALRGYRPAENLGEGKLRPFGSSSSAHDSCGGQPKTQVLEEGSTSFLPRKSERNVAYGGGLASEDGHFEHSGERTRHDSMRALVGSPTAADASLNSLTLKPSSHGSSVPIAGNANQDWAEREEEEEVNLLGDIEEENEEEYFRRIEDATLYGRLVAAAAAQEEALNEPIGDLENEPPPQEMASADDGSEINVHRSSISKNGKNAISSDSNSNSQARPDFLTSAITSSSGSLADWSGLSKSHHFNTTADEAATTTTIATTKDSRLQYPVTGSHGSSHHNKHNQSNKNELDEIPIARFLNSLKLSGDDDTPSSGTDVASALQFNTLLDLIPTGNLPCIVALDEDEVNGDQKQPIHPSSSNSTINQNASEKGELTRESRPSMTYNALRRFVAEDFPSILVAAGLHPGDSSRSSRGSSGSLNGNSSLDERQQSARPRLATLIPNGPEAATVLVGCVACGVCCPMNYSSTAAEITSELASLGAPLVLALESPGDSSSNNHILTAASACGLPVALLAPTSYPHPRGLVILSRLVPPSPTLTSPPLPVLCASSWSFTRRHEVALVLHTSGTTGARKRVPHTLDNLCVGAALVAQSWKLSPSDVCCNMMPLFHVGGIARNLMAPLLSGGAVVCLPAFDPQDFWRCLDEHRATWYYAAPTMHQQIIALCPPSLHNRNKNSESSSKSSNSENHSLDAPANAPYPLSEPAKRHPGQYIRMVANAAGGLLPSLAESLKRTFPNAVVLPSYGMTECMPISTPPQSYRLERPGTSGIAVGPEIAIFRTFEDDQEANDTDETLNEFNRDSSQAFDDDGIASVASSDYFGYANEKDEIDDANYEDGASSTTSSRQKFGTDSARSLGQSKRETMKTGLLVESFIEEEDGVNDSWENDLSGSGSLRMSTRQGIGNLTGTAPTAGDRYERGEDARSRRGSKRISGAWPRRAKPLEIGRIAVRGAPLFQGYENDHEATSQAFILGQGWFDTGDLGCLDEQDYLYITGRSKEVINRGGELISPFEVEEVFQQHPAMHEVLAVGVPHERLQEVVGLVIVPKAHMPWPSDLGLLQRYAAQRQLHPFKWPQVVIFMPQGLPRGPTGKFQRIDFAKRAQLPTLRDDSNNDGNVNSHDKTEASYISSTNRANAEITTESTAIFEANYPSVNGISSGGLSSSSSGSLSSLSNIKCFPIRYDLDRLVSATTATLLHANDHEQSNNCTAAVALPESAKMWAKYTMAAVLWRSIDDGSQQVCLYLAPPSEHHVPPPPSSSPPQSPSAETCKSDASGPSRATGNSSSTGGTSPEMSAASPASSYTPPGAPTRESVLARLEAMKAKKSNKSASKNTTANDGASAPSPSKRPIVNVAASVSEAAASSVAQEAAAPSSVDSSQAELWLLRHLASVVHAHLVPHHVIVLDCPLPVTTEDAGALGTTAEGGTTSSIANAKINEAENGDDSNTGKKPRSPLGKGDRGINSGDFARWALSPTTLMPAAPQSEHASVEQSTRSLTPIASAVSPGALVVPNSTSRHSPRGSSNGEASSPHLCLNLSALPLPPQVNARKRRAVFDAVPHCNINAPEEEGARADKNEGLHGLGSSSTSSGHSSNSSSNSARLEATPHIPKKEDDTEAARKARAKKKFYADRDALLQKARAQKQSGEEHERVDEDDNEQSKSSNALQIATPSQSSPLLQPLHDLSVADSRPAPPATSQAVTARSHNSLSSSSSSEAAMTTKESEVLSMVTGAWIEVLNIPRGLGEGSRDDAYLEDTCGIDEDFFEMGGSSLLAGRLVSRVRQLSNVPPGRSLNATTIFTHRTIRSIAKALCAAQPSIPSPIHSSRQDCHDFQHGSTPIQQQQEEEREEEHLLEDFSTKFNEGNRRSSPPPTHQEDHNKRDGSSQDGAAAAAAMNVRSDSASTFDLNHAAELNLCVMATQLIPLLFFGPFKRVINWTIIVSLWVIFTRDVFEPLHVRLPRLMALLTALAVGKVLVVGLLLPLLGLAGKWLVIGRYRPGCHAPWSFYYLRWWLVDQWLDICGRGLFVLSPFGLRLYYRLAGCAVGLDCVVSPRATLREFDLVQLGDGCAVDDALIRGFAVDRGTVIFNSVKVGTGASVGAKSSVAPGTSVPPYCQLGPLSSSYEGSVDYVQKCSDADKGLFLAPQMRRRLRLSIAAAKTKNSNSKSNNHSQFFSSRHFLSLFNSKANVATSYSRVPQETTTKTNAKHGSGDRKINDVINGDDENDDDYDKIDKDDDLNDDAIEDDSNRRYVRSVHTNQCARWPWKVCVGWPSLCLVKSVGALPWLLIVLRMVAGREAYDRPLHSFSDAVIWFSRPERAGFYILTRIAVAILTPPLELATAVALKRLLVGQILPGPRPKDPHSWATFRLWLAQALVPGGDLRGVTKLVGSHYETVSRLYRLLGAKIGQRVYWPGTGLGGLSGLFDLLEVGNDVTFGSRSIVMPGDAHTLETVSIGAGAMVADRCVLHPGVHVGRLATLGSGTLAPRGWKVLPGGMVVGSRRGQPLVLVEGDANGAAADANTPTITPFGAAFYRVKNSKNHVKNNPPKNFYHDDDPLSSTPPPYYVYGEWQVGCLHVGAVLLGTLLRAATLPSALSLAVYWVRNSSSDHGSLSSSSSTWSDSGGSSSSYDRSRYDDDDDDSSALSSAPDESRSDFLNHVLRRMSTSTTLEHPSPSSSSSMLHFSCHFLGSFFLALALVSFLVAVLSLAIDVSAKWLLIGRRTSGPHPWDKDSYCQRWQVYLAVSSAARGPILDRLRGSGWLNAYFRSLGAAIGPRVLLYPTRGDPMMTEPDLVEIGAGACIDDASLICHLNSRGHFALNPLVIGQGATMRSGSRLLSGACMEPHACLLEHTLVLSGDVAPARGVLQGWPSESYRPSAVPL